MFKKLISTWSLKTAYKKGFKGGSTIWTYWFAVVVIFKIVKFLFAKPAPKVIDQYDLEPGEYKVTVNEKKGR